MSIVLCGRSALEYHRTPPVLMDWEIPVEQATAPLSAGGAGTNPATFRLRANAREAERTIIPRLLTDLKGLSLPVHVMVDGTVRRNASSCIAFHRLPEKLRDQVVDIDRSLSTLSPVGTLASLAMCGDFIPLCKIAMELMGIYAIHRETPLTRMVVNELLARGVLSVEAQRSYPDHIRAFYDAAGKPISFFARNGGAIPWEVSFDRRGRPTDLWRRAPKMDMDELRMFVSGYKGARGAKLLASVAANTRPGAASPLETKWLLALCLGYRRGGEQWSWPWLNRQIEFDDVGRCIAGQRASVCDALWEDEKVVLEVLGEEFHTDALGFKLHSDRTTALEHLGYTVREVTNEQLMSYEKYEATVQLLAEKLGFALLGRGKAFEARQRRLLAALNDYRAEY